jgi:hydrogenase maturation protease
MDPHDFVILVDACPRGDAPGSLYVIEPDPVDAGDQVSMSVEGHGMNPTNVLRMVKSMGGAPPPMLIVGCEPLDLGSFEEGKLGLTPTVEAAVDEAVQLIETLVSKIHSGVLEQGPAMAALQSH